MRTARPVVVALLVFLAASCSTQRRRQFQADPTALGPYSAFVLHGGLCFVSGKIGQTGGSFVVEVETAIDAVEYELDRADVSIAQVVAVTVYLTDMNLYDELNEVYARRFHQPYPSRTCVAVARLPADARVEITCVAARDP